MATAGKDFLIGQSGKQDTFVFTLGDEYGAGTPENMVTIMTSVMTNQVDFIDNFDPGEGDKIKIMDGGSPLSPAEAASLLDVASMGGMHATYVKRVIRSPVCQHSA